VVNPPERESLVSKSGKFTGLGEIPNVLNLAPSEEIPNRERFPYSKKILSRKSQFKKERFRRYFQN